MKSVLLRGKFLILALLWSAAPLALASLQTDVAIEKISHHLELVRNQIELTIENHASLAQDVLKQEREFSGMNVYERIPLAQNDSKDSRALLNSLKADFTRAAEKHTGFRLKKIRFTAQWKSTHRSIPTELPFDTDFHLTEVLVVDSRPVEFTVDFDDSAPLDVPAWLREQQFVIKRLLVPVAWTRVGHRLTGRVLIFRYRDFEYPRMLAPDLARYATPDILAGRTALDAVATSALRRIKQYRQEIIKMWPECQPHLDNLRAFARNDARMNFFLSHANVQ